MARVSLTKIEKRYGHHVVIPDLDLEVEDGEFLVLVGPSGCGKSTTLQMIAGLESISSGSLRIGGRDVTHLPPKSRDIAMVFQSYALFPHLDVRDNIAFGLKIRRVPAAEMAQQAQGRGRAPAHREPAGSTAASALGWTTPARGPGTSTGTPSRRLPDGRAPVQPRCQNARRSAQLSQQDASGARDHHRLRHARPVRSHDHGLAHRRDERGAHPAGGTADGDLQRAGQSVRGRVHRLAGHELPHPSHRGRRRAARLHRRVRAADRRAHPKDARGVPAARGGVGCPTGIHRADSARCRRADRRLSRSSGGGAAPGP